MYVTPTNQNPSPVPAGLPPFVRSSAPTGPALAIPSGPAAPSSLALDEAAARLAALVQPERSESAVEASLHSADTVKIRHLATEDGASSGRFQALGAILQPDASGEVHEEELFAATLAVLLSEESPAAGQAFLEGLASRVADPAVSAEEAAIEVLRELVADGSLTAESGDRLYSAAFAAAQLDENTEALFDGRGGPGDATVAKEAHASALRVVDARLAAFDAGAEAPAARSLAAARPTGAAPTASAGGAESTSGIPADARLGEGFVFKPASERDGKLVIILPDGLKGGVAAVRLLNAEGKRIEAGESSGLANGDREHFRFDRPGRRYPADLTVQVELLDGRLLERTIADPSRREA
ncbi:MAG: hypothetical protein R3F20_13665 [Planctomycetota bacterium]